jgi:hypothetical protein
MISRSGARSPPTANKPLVSLNSTDGKTNASLSRKTGIYISGSFKSEQLR